MDLQKRVKRLERDNCWMKRIGIVVVLLCGIAASLGFQAAQAPTTQMKEFEQATRLTQKGKRLTAEQAQKLEEQLKANPKDLSLRTQLLGYYFSKSFRSEDARKARYTHVLWIIENHPDAAIAGQPEAMLHLQLEKENYQTAKALWLKQVDKHKNRATVLGNAARFFQLSDEERAESLLSKARTLEPNNPQWARQLGLLYRLQAGEGIQSSAEKRKEFSAKALKQFEDALKAMKAEIERSALLQYVAVVALDAGELKKAEAYATEMLTKASSHKSDWNYGNAVHHGNLILGRLALGSGDLAKAKKHLIEAGKTPGSPQLNSFGPNMTLAKELLKKGEKEIVLEYFQLCSKFWKRDRLKQWTDEVEKGRVPNFGGNLLY
jgi:Flp pilus assembly protein TadD